MTTTENDAQIPNAGAIIERFGGLRPMATKIGVAVTTIQGWKKRETIPANRASQIMDAARAYGITIDDLMTAVPTPAIPTTKPFFPVTPEAPKEKEEPAFGGPYPTYNPEPFVHHQKPVIEKAVEKPFEPQPIVTPIPPTAPPAPKRDAAQATWTSVAVLALAVIIGLIAMGPGIMRLIAQEKRIATLAQDLQQLDDQIRDVRGQNAILSGFVPDQIKSEIAGLQDRAQKAEELIATLGTQTKALTQGVMGDGEGTIEQRLASVEDKVSKIDVIDAGAEFSNFLTRIQQLSNTPEGQNVLSTSTDIFYRAVLSDTSAPLGPRLSRAVANAPVLKQVVGDMPENDLTNAVIILASLRLRDAVAHATPFDDTARVLRAVPGLYSNADQIALDKITLIGKTGAPTLKKLNTDFATLKDKIVADSLAAPDVTMHDKLNAFMSGMVRIERDGKPVTGTAVQKSVGSAAYAFSTGDVATGIDTLMTLNGPAAATAQPFVQGAENYLAAQTFLNDLVKRVSARISAAGFIAGMTPGARVDVNTLSRGLMQSLITQGQ